MGWETATPTDTSTSASRTDPPDGAGTTTDDSGSSGATGSYDNVRISVTYDLDVSASGLGASATAKWEYSTNGGSSWTTGNEITCVAATSPKAEDDTVVVDLGAADISQIVVRSSAFASQGIGTSAVSTADIDNWFIEYLSSRRIILVN